MSVNKITVVQQDVLKKTYKIRYCQVMRLMKLIKRKNNINKFGANFTSTIIVLSAISSILLISIPVSACYYTVGTYENDYSTSKISFYTGETVFGKGTADVNKLLKLRIKDPSNNIVYYSNESHYVVNCSYTLNDSAPTGIWKIQLGIYNCGWVWSTKSNRIAYFSVNDTNFTLAINIDGNGTVIKDPDKLNYEYGDIVNVNVISDPGWNFSHWTGDIFGSDNSTNILMDSNKTITAHFIKNQYVINISIIGNGTVTKDPDQFYYSFGSVINLTAVSYTGYVFDHWESDLSSNSNPATITIDGNKNVKAIFIKSYYTITVNVNPIDSGFVDINPPEPYYDGDIVNLSAIANQGSFFDHWSGDLNGSCNPATIVMDGNKTITAHFIVKTFNLTIDIIGNGYVIKDPDQENYAYATLVNLSATADSDWIFDHWTGDLTGDYNPVIINITDNKNITANFIMSKNGNETEGGGGEVIPTGGNGGPKSSGVKQNKPPIADAGGPYYGITNENIDLNASNSYDPDHYIESWHWDFGDGTSGYGEIVKHSYSKAGYYSVILVVTDTIGALSNDTADVFISEPNQPPSNLEIKGPIEGIINTYYNYTIISTDEEDDKIKYVIDWGDGNKSESDYIPAGKYFNVKYKWPDVGNYKIIVTADDNESVSKVELEIIIIDEPSEPQIPEDTNFALIIILIIAIIFLLLLLIYAKRRRKKDQEENKNQK